VLSAESNCVFPCSRHWAPNEATSAPNREGLGEYKYREISKRNLEVYIAQVYVSSCLSRYRISSVETFITFTVVIAKSSNRNSNVFKSVIVTLLSLIPFWISYLKVISVAHTASFNNLHWILQIHESSVNGSIHSLTHGAEPFLRSRQFCSYSPLPLHVSLSIDRRRAD
jgi:hypothetical protein